MRHNSFLHCHRSTKCCRANTQQRSVWPYPLPLGPAPVFHNQQPRSFTTNSFLASCRTNGNDKTNYCICAQSNDFFIDTYAVKLARRCLPFVISRELVPSSKIWMKEHNSSLGNEWRWIGISESGFTSSPVPSMNLIEEYEFTKLCFATFFIVR
jgi:hypothetical protein